MKNNQQSMDEYFDKLENELNLISNELEDWNIKYFNTHKSRYKNDLEIIDNYYKSGEIIEIGSLPCHMTYLLSKKGYSVKGLDLDPKRSTKFIKKNNLKVIKCDIENEPLPIKDNTADFIIFNEIFEHLRINPIKTLEEINRILKPGGILMLSTPNLYSLATIFRFNMGRGINNPYVEFNKLNTLGHMGHVREYSNREIKEFINNSGFKLVKVHYSSYGKLNKGIYKYILGPFLYIFPSFNLFQINIITKTQA